MPAGFCSMLMSVNRYRISNFPGEADDFEFFKIFLIFKAGRQKKTHSQSIRRKILYKLIYYTLYIYWVVRRRSA